MRWEYATVQRTTVGAQMRRADGFVLADRWIMTDTDFLWVQGVYVAKWTCSYPADADRPLGYSYSFEPDPDNQPEWRNTMRSSRDLLGSKGWELVSFSPTQTLLQQNTTTGWPATTSRPYSWISIFKRPVP